VTVLPHKVFERKGDDLHCEVPVDLYTAVLGGKTSVPTLVGTVSLKIPPETQGGRTFRLKGQGMPRLRDSSKRGDLYAKVKVVLPKDLSAREKEIFKELAHLYRPVPQ
jgi:DnaJ-class molecular chaperone